MHGEKGNAKQAQGLKKVTKEEIAGGSTIVNFNDGSAGACMIKDVGYWAFIREWSISACQHTRGEMASPRCCLMCVPTGIDRLK